MAIRLNHNNELIKSNNDLPLCVCLIVLKKERKKTVSPKKVLERFF